MAPNRSLSTQEVAELLHVSKSTIYELIRRGEINSYKVGRKVRFTQDDVDAYIARSRHEQSVQPVRRVTVSVIPLPSKTPPKGFSAVPIIVVTCRGASSRKTFSAVS